MGTMQVDSRDSYENVSTKWMGEIKEHCPGVKMVLAALKCDLREESNHSLDVITFEQGLEKARDIGAVKYLGKIGKLQYLLVTSNGRKNVDGI